MKKYSVILGNLGNTRDRFCAGYKDNPDTLTMLRRAASIPHVDGIELVGTWDIRPDNVRDMKLALADAGKQCVSIIPDLFANPRFFRGSFSAPDPEVRAFTQEYLRVMCDIALELGCELINLWPGQDGYDYLLSSNYEAQRQWCAEGVSRIATEYPSLRFALEYKPKEPRVRSYISRMADTLILVNETGLPNVGVCMDAGHAFIAGESLGEAIVLAKRAGGGYADTAGRLFHTHFNDNHGAWDDDMIVGSVHLPAYIEGLYWLDRCGYTGWLSMDQYPYREDAAAAIGESIQWLRTLDRLVVDNRSELDRLVDSYDAVSVSRFIREKVLRAIFIDDGTTALLWNNE